MDRTGKIILVVSVLAMIFGMPLAMRLGLIKMSPPEADQNATGTNQEAQAGTNTPEETPTNPPAISTSTPAATNQPAPPVGVEIPAVEESTLSLINASGKAVFTFTSLGGGVKRVDLLDYPKEVGGDTGDPVALKNDGGLMPLLAL